MDKRPPLGRECCLASDHSGVDSDTIGFAWERIGWLILKLGCLTCGCFQITLRRGQHVGCYQPSSVHVKTQLASRVSEGCDLEKPLLVVPVSLASSSGLCLALFGY